MLCLILYYYALRNEYTLYTFMFILQDAFVKKSAQVKYIINI